MLQELLPSIAHNGQAWDKGTYSGFAQKTPLMHALFSSVSFLRVRARRVYHSDMRCCALPVQAVPCWRAVFLWPC